MNNATRRSRLRNWAILLVLLLFLFVSEQIDRQFLPPIAALALCGFILYWWLITIKRNAALEDEADDWPVDDVGDNSHVKQEESAYSILGVTSTANAVEIRKAYRQIARSLHPDNFSNEEKEQAANRLARVHLAYEIISDVYTRFDYDLFVRACKPEFPSLEESHRYIEDRHEIVREAADELEVLAKRRSTAGVQSVDADSEVEAPTSHGLSAQLGHSAPPSETRSQSPAQENECQACGLPYQNDARRDGPIYCVRCGTQMA